MSVNRVLVRVHVGLTVRVCVTCVCLCEWVCAYRCMRLRLCQCDFVRSWLEHSRQRPNGAEHWMVDRQRLSTISNKVNTEYPAHTRVHRHSNNDADRHKHKYKYKYIQAATTYRFFGSLALCAIECASSCCVFFFFFVRSSFVLRLLGLWRLLCHVHQH